MPASDDAPARLDATPDPGAGRRLELYLRDSYPPALAETIQNLRERCAQLETADVVDGYRVEQWPPCAPSGDDAAGRSPRRELVSAFEEWAARHGYALEPAFYTQTVTSSMLEEDVRYEYTAVPLLTLALYEDGELRGVAPCTDGDRTYTVEDGLAALERERWNAFPASPGAQDASTPAEVSQE